MHHRRVHISQSTMECLHGEFDVEPGDGGERCDYLKEKGYETFLVVVPNGKEGLKGLVSGISSHICHLYVCMYWGIFRALRCCIYGGLCICLWNNKMHYHLSLSLPVCLSIYLPLFLILFKKLSVDTPTPNSPALINTTECNGSIHTACTTPAEEPEELDMQVYIALSSNLAQGVGSQI